MTKRKRSGGTEKLPRETQRQRARREMESGMVLPWEMPPSFAVTENPPAWASEADRLSWPKARRLREEIREKYGDEYFDYLPDEEWWNPEP